MTSEYEPLFDGEQLDLLRDALGVEELSAMLAQLPDAATDSLRSVEAALAADDLEAARRAAHMLKGFSSSLGAARLSSIAREIELELETTTTIAARLPALVAMIDATVAEIPRAAAGG